MCYICHYQNRLSFWRNVNLWIYNSSNTFEEIIPLRREIVGRVLDRTCVFVAIWKIKLLSRYIKGYQGYRILRLCKITLKIFGTMFIFIIYLHHHLHLPFSPPRTKVFPILPTCTVSVPAKPCTFFWDRVHYYYLSSSQPSSAVQSASDRRRFLGPSSSYFFYIHHHHCQTSSPSLATSIDR